TYTYSQAVIDGGGRLVLPRLLSSQKKSAPFVPFTIVSESTYNTNGSIKGDLLKIVRKWVDEAGNSVGSQVDTEYEYDGNGTRLSEIRKRTINGSTVQFIKSLSIYDGENRVVSNIVSVSVDNKSTWTVLQTNSVTYNKLGRQATSVDAVGHVTSTIYDYAGNL